MTLSQESMGKEELSSRKDNVEGREEVLFGAYHISRCGIRGINESRGLAKGRC